MNALLNQFLNEARDFLEAIGGKLLELERDPDQASLMDEVFRLVHTLKGNSGLFDLPKVTQVLHAGEDLLDGVRDGRVPFGRALADQLLEAMDFVGAMLDEVAATPAGDVGDTRHHGANAGRISGALRALIGTGDGAAAESATQGLEEAGVVPSSEPQAEEATVWEDIDLPEGVRMALYRELLAGTPCCLLIYEPEEGCFFKGEDPFFLVSQLPAPLWRRLSAREPWPPLAELDAYQCMLRFELVAALAPDAVAEHFRYVPDQVRILPLDVDTLVRPTGRVQDWALAAELMRTALGQVDAQDRAPLAQAARTLLELSAPDLCVASGMRWLLLVLELEPDNTARLRALLDAIGRHCQDAAGLPAAAHPAIPASNSETGLAFQSVIRAQRAVLELTGEPDWLAGRLRAAAASLANAFGSLNAAINSQALDRALAAAVSARDPAPLRDWLASQRLPILVPDDHPAPDSPASDASAPATESVSATGVAADKAGAEEPIRFGRRAEDQLTTPRTLKVDQEKIDRLMNLVGEMVVAKNALPYLAGRAETVHGVRELSREIKAQYGVINRIAEELQDAMMQVRLLPVSFIFQRFPRLVRDIANKLGKEVDLVMEGESTEADKNIIEALADPLIHIVRNSLDHGLERPEERERAGKPRVGRLRISAQPLSDRVVIEISDDGRGIDPAVIKRKAYEKGLIDEAALERVDDQEALNLVFAAGFSTAAEVTSLSGRGVGMDVVRNAIARVKGAIDLRSRVGEGTELRLSLPLSLAVTNVMIIESAGQRFGIPMDAVAETVRVPRTKIHTIKQRQTTVLRDRVVPLVALGQLLALDVAPVANDDNELAVVVVRVEQEEMGIIVDDCRKTVDIILKPMEGLMASIPGYAGSALLGDGSVLLVLNPTELL